MEREEQKNNKKKAIIVSSMSIAVVLLIVGISYAFWQATKIQEDTNIIASGCFGVTLEGENPIDLTTAYPITEAAGMSTTPYTFTITNICEGEAIYNVNLEALSNTTFQNENIRVALDDTNKLYSEYGAADKYYNSSKDSRTLIGGTLESSGTVTYNLRIWIDEDAPNSEQNKVFASKIVITTGEGGEIIKSLADKVELGDYILMTPTSTSYIIPAGVTGYEESQEINPSELKLWRVIKKNADGTVDVVSEYISSEKVIFKGKTGYMNLVGVLNTIAAQYTNQKYVKSTRHIGYSNQIEYCANLEECPADEGYIVDMNLMKQALISFVSTSPGGIELNSVICARGRGLNKSGVDIGISPTYTVFQSHFFFYSEGGEDLIAHESIRPVLTLKSSINIKSGDGQNADTAYTFE